MMKRVVGASLLVALTLAFASASVRADGPSEPARAKIKHVSEVDASKGNVVIDELITPGVTTIVDVFSQACPPCRALSPKLDKLSEKRAGLRVLKLNIGTIQGEEGREINWKAPLIGKLGIHSIPHLILFDKKGKQIAQGEEAYLKVAKWLKEEKITN